MRLQTSGLLFTDMTGYDNRLERFWRMDGNDDFCIGRDLPGLRYWDI